MKKGRSVEHIANFDLPEVHTGRVPLEDSDVRESLIACGVLCALLLGWPYVLSWLWVAARGLAARKRPAGGPILVCGHRLESGEISVQYRARLDEAAFLAARCPEQPVLLLGGGRPSEAAAGRDYLLRAHRIDPRRVFMEQASADSMENLRNARNLLRARNLRGKPVLISSRYHLARLSAFSRPLGLSCRLHPAGARRQLRPADLKASLFEAACLCWFVSGLFYARVAGRHQLLARIR